MLQGMPEQTKEQKQKAKPHLKPVLSKGIGTESPPFLLSPPGGSRGDKGGASVSGLQHGWD